MPGPVFMASRFETDNGQQVYLDGAPKFSATELPSRSAPVSGAAMSDSRVYPNNSIPAECLVPERARPPRYCFLGSSGHSDVEIAAVEIFFAPPRIPRCCGRDGRTPLFRSAPV